MRFRPAIDAATGEYYLPVTERGAQLLEEPLLNKGAAFTWEEREALGLRGLLPAHTSTMEEELLRVREQLDAKSSDLERHIYLAALHDRNETLFYRFVIEHLEETVPIIYTPTVADACRHWSRIFRQARGVYVTPRDRGDVARVLRSRGVREVAVIVVTDNERILGIGDQGAGGMGIPIGKLALYTVGAGIHPSLCLPVSLDVGTNNDDLLDDPLYLGWREKRLRGDAYWSLVDEFVHAVKEVFPGAMLQWEDFANLTSFANLNRYRETLPSFNDDIQGTAAMVLGGLLAAMRFTSSSLRDQVFVIAGAGSAGDGIAAQIIDACVAAGADQAEMRRRIFVTDSKGLLVEGRAGMDDRKKALAADLDQVAGWDATRGFIDLAAVVHHARPTILIGVSGQCGLFTEPMVREMTTWTERPIVMPLSNPTSCTEAVPEDLMAWTEGRAMVATGSPFADVVIAGEEHRVGQANNVFIFPGVGLGVTASKARTVTTGMFIAAAEALADCVGDDLLKAGALYPPMTQVRAVSHKVAHAVAEQAVREGVARAVVDIEGIIEQTMWSPVYLPYRAA